MHPEFVLSELFIHSYKVVTFASRISIFSPRLFINSIQVLNVPIFTLLS
nr:MAG TPA: hypothetical protein [Caudoviricetes sp.]